MTASSYFTTRKSHESRAEVTSRIAREITHAEEEARAAKTARLKAARLAAETAAPKAAKPKARTRRPAVRASAAAKV